MGTIWADDPIDRLVPSERKLQALRVFANQATTALDTAAQYEEMQFLAEHDPLTRLLNRRGVQRAARAGGVAVDALRPPAWRSCCAI